MKPRTTPGTFDSPGSDAPIMSSALAKQSPGSPEESSSDEPIWKDQPPSSPYMKAPMPQAIHKARRTDGSGYFMHGLATQTWYNQKQRMLAEVLIENYDDEIKGSDPVTVYQDTPVVMEALAQDIEEGFTAEQKWVVGQLAIQSIMFQWAEDNSYTSVSQIQFDTFMKKIRERIDFLRPSQDTWSMYLIISELVENIMKDSLIWEKQLLKNKLITAYYNDPYTPAPIPRPKKNFAIPETIDPYSQDEVVIPSHEEFEDREDSKLNEDEKPPRHVTDEEQYLAYEDAFGGFAQDMDPMEAMGSDSDLDIGWGSSPVKFETSADKMPSDGDDEEEFSQWELERFKRFRANRSVLGFAREPPGYREWVRREQAKEENWRRARGQGKLDTPPGTPDPFPSPAAIRGVIGSEYESPSQISSGYPTPPPVPIQGQAPREKIFRPAPRYGDIRRFDDEKVSNWDSLYKADKMRQKIQDSKLGRVKQWKVHPLEGILEDTDDSYWDQETEVDSEFETDTESDIPTYEAAGTPERDYDEPPATPQRSPYESPVMDPNFFGSPTTFSSPQPRSPFASTNRAAASFDPRYSFSSPQQVSYPSGSKEAASAPASQYTISSPQQVSYPSGSRNEQFSSMVQKLEEMIDQGKITLSEESTDHVRTLLQLSRIRDKIKGEHAALPRAHGDMDAHMAASDPQQNHLSDSVAKYTYGDGIVTHRDSQGYYEIAMAPHADSISVMTLLHALGQEKGILQDYKSGKTHAVDKEVSVILRLQRWMNGIRNSRPGSTVKFLFKPMQPSGGGFVGGEFTSLIMGHNSRQL